MSDEKLPILLVPDPRLKLRARAAMPADRDQMAALVPQLLATMYAAPGIGLAAPQGHPHLRVAVIDLQPEGRREPLVLVNPEVVAHGAAREEGCLSLPNIYAEVERPVAVRVRWHDLDGRRHEIDAEGLLARCLQHEIDHLDGVLFTDRISALKRNMLLRRFAKERARA